MAQNNPYAAYQTARTVTSSKTQLLVMLHDGAIRFLSHAAIATKQQEWEKKSINFNKAINIIDHLWGTLDREKGGEIATNLEMLYAYMHRQLLIANAKNDIGIIKEVMTHLREVREAWAQVSLTTATGTDTTGAAPGEELKLAA